MRQMTHAQKRKYCQMEGRNYEENQEDDARDPDGYRSHHDAADV